MELNEITKIVEELYFNSQIDKIIGYIQLPLLIFEVIALYKINQIIKIYIKENEKFLK